MDKLTDLGEYAVHDLIARALNDTGTRWPIGDDAAVIEFGRDTEDVLLISTDRLAAGVPPRLRARLLIVQTLSDVVCMGGRPLAMVLAVQIPRDDGVDELISFLRQAQEEARIYGCEIVGGDTKEGSNFSVVGTAVALAHADEVIRRNGAGTGDVVAVTMCGRRQWGARWAYHLARTYKLSLTPAVSQALADADVNFSFPARESRALAAAKVASAGLDLSDGLGAGIKILSRASEVGFRIDHAAVSKLVDPDLAVVCDPLQIPLESLAWSPGYMWENLYTIPGEGWEEAEAAVHGVGGRLSPIGEVVEGNKVTNDSVDTDLMNVASDEKFRSWAWEDRTQYWLDGIRRELT